MKNKITSTSGYGNDREYVSGKHQANLKKTGSLYFQIGLILSLLIVFGVFQIRFPYENKEVAVNFDDPYEKSVEYDMSDFRIIKANHSQQSSSQQNAQVRPLVLDEFKITEDDVVEEDLTKTFLTPEVDTFVPLDVDGVEDGDPVDEPGDFSIYAVHQVPVFPGCEGLSDNKERIACMSDKIRDVIKNNFNADIASDYGLSGKQKIYVQFSIDENGNVAKIESRAPVKALQIEAERVINKIPQMTPGKVNNKNVVVKYSVPIIFEVY